MSPTASEPCALCGDDTAAGGPLYSDRHVLQFTEGVRTYLCSACEVRVRRSGFRSRPSDGELPKVDGNGLLAIIDTLRTGQRI
jgi:hypothetical protein